MLGAHGPPELWYPLNNAWLIAARYRSPSPPSTNSHVDRHLLIMEAYDGT